MRCLPNSQLITYQHVHPSGCTVLFRSVWGQRLAAATHRPEVLRCWLQRWAEQNWTELPLVLTLSWGKRAEMGRTVLHCPTYPGPTHRTGAKSSQRWHCRARVGKLPKVSVSPIGSPKLFQVYLHFGIFTWLPNSKSSLAWKAVWFVSVYLKQSLEGMFIALWECPTCLLNTVCSCMNTLRYEGFDDLVSWAFFLTPREIF